jgi:hypothetical protein
MCFGNNVATLTGGCGTLTATANNRLTAVITDVKNTCPDYQLERPYLDQALAQEAYNYLSSLTVARMTIHSGPSGVGTLDPE